MPNVAVVFPDGEIWGVIVAVPNDTPPVETTDLIVVPALFHQRVNRAEGWRYNHGQNQFVNPGSQPGSSGQGNQGQGNG
jgi:hypothetical protein